MKTSAKIREKTPGKTTFNTRKTAEQPREKILAILKGNTCLSTGELASMLGLSPKGVEWHLTKLKQEGRLRRVGPDKGSHWEVTENDNNL